ncbi:mitochondrial transcription rescue factor 1 [Diabrotica undecimpunctata]|uniref:mitochondrial transcription rescue factor 1 n=1 Tax=Diabrotica undecimpunctata TaxID=50387 RepID=UPI003B63D87A
MSSLFNNLFKKAVVHSIVENSLKAYHFQRSVLLVPKAHPKFAINRYKSKSSRNKGKLINKVTESETESDTKDDDIFDINDKSAKNIEVRVSSLRADSVLKVGLGISRNKLETIFYEGRIRLNGAKIPKKSVSVRENDELDVIKGKQTTNSDFLTISRIVLLGIKAEEDIIKLKLRRHKSLTVENYEGRDAWTQSESNV